ncbi:ankyrin repeats (3 copies) domain-containing protein [Ditylenchus destructor]|uniref:Ankyrin repeats (3 copies) domain-containing protein n=1 Tax=Ditylenchus destructor TaxID=166010 RepID=A0AAD4MX40_9BILA|nr:ankyrin repeats (3 copies) domain-containing protein [Ditylenchus destructor]
MFETCDNRISRTSFGSDSNLGPLDDRVILNAVESGCLESILRLLVRGFNANSRIGSTTALHVAVNHNRNTVIEYLLLNDAKINNVDDDLNTPLHVAARIGQTIVVYQLLKKNSNKSLKNRNGQTPLDIAMEACHADIVTLLRLHELESSNDDMSVTMTDVDNFIDDLAAKQKLEMEEKASISTE